MLDGIKEKKHIYIKNFFSKDELSILQSWCLDRALKSTSDNIVPWPSVTAASFYEDPLMTIMLKNKLKKAEEISKLKLYSTYTFWRAYTFGSQLSKHTDRPSCEISITACVDSCGSKWPIQMENNTIDIEIGDAVMYLGMDVLHGRNDYFKGNYMAQVFFHYVDQKGDFSDFKNDALIKKRYNLK